MITANSAREIAGRGKTRNVSKELARINTLLMESCGNGAHSISVKGVLHPETKRILEMAGYRVTAAG